MNNCKYCKADCALRGEENLKECKVHIHMSNADRIRSMSDEELAKFLYEIGYDGGWLSPEGTIEWLQKPVEEA